MFFRITIILVVSGDWNFMKAKVPLSLLKKLAKSITYVLIIVNSSWLHFLQRTSVGNPA